MKNKAFEGFLFKLTHPVSYDFTTEERELIAENVEVKTKIATGADIDIADVRRLINDGSSDLTYYKTVGKIAAAWEDVGFVAEMQKMLAVIGEYHRLKRDSESLRAFAEKDRNEYGKRK